MAIAGIVGPPLFTTVFAWSIAGRWPRRLVAIALVLHSLATRR